MQNKDRQTYRRRKNHHLIILRKNKNRNKNQEVDFLAERSTFFAKIFFPIKSFLYLCSAKGKNVSRACDPYLLTPKS